MNCENLVENTVLGSDARARIILRQTVLHVLVRGREIMTRRNLPGTENSGKRANEISEHSMRPKTHFVMAWEPIALYFSRATLMRSENEEIWQICTRRRTGMHRKQCSVSGEAGEFLQARAFDSA